jgi:hypothetical protein
MPSLDAPRRTPTLNPHCHTDMSRGLNTGTQSASESDRLRAMGRQSVARGLSEHFHTQTSRETACNDRRLMRTFCSLANTEPRVEVWSRMGKAGGPHALLMSKHCPCCLSFLGVVKLLTEADKHRSGCTLRVSTRLFVTPDDGREPQLTARSKDGRVPFRDIARGS